MRSKTPSGMRAIASSAAGFAAALLATLAVTPAGAAISCARNLVADVVALDQPIMFNRLGAANVNGMMFALKRDVVAKGTAPVAGTPLSPGAVQLRPDKRPRPIVLRVAAGDCLTINLTNLLAPAPNPNNVDLAAVPRIGVFVDEQVLDRHVGFHANGMQLVNGIADDGTYVGANSNSTTLPGQTQTYTLYAEKEGVFAVHSYGATFGGDANQGNTGNGLFGQIIVEPRGAKTYRSLLTEEEMRLVTTSRTTTGHPVINYEAVYPNQEPWASEGKAGLPVLNMIQNDTIVHTELEAMIAGPAPNGTFPASTYPLESAGYRNPTLPNRLEPFRDFASMFHDEADTAQAFPGFYNDPVFKYVLEGVKDAFMINYGSGGIGSEIIANRLGVGPMHDCLACAYEEFFLTSHVVGDPALLVDVPANAGLEAVAPGQAPPPGAVGPKANVALYPNDPINVHSSYTGDFVKIRNTHVGKEQHVFHLHNHQWLYNPNDDNSNYLDAQGIGPGVGYTYEINFGGSGNRNKSAGDAIFHCHFYPHFAQGMWYHWRHHDVLEEGTLLQVSVEGTTTVADKPGTFHSVPFAQQNGKPAAGSRALPDGELLEGVPMVAIVPLPGKPMAPIPAQVEVVANATLIPNSHPNPSVRGRPVGSVAKVTRETQADGSLKNPGYPFWIAGIEDTVGQRPPTPVLDMLTKDAALAMKSEDPTLFATIVPDQADGWDGGLPRHSLKGYAAGGADSANVVAARDFTKSIGKAAAVFYPEGGTDLERAAMRFHKKGAHPTSVANLDGSAVTGATFVTNGIGPVVGAPYHEPCRDDNGKQMASGYTGSFFSGGAGTSQFSVNASVNAGGKEFKGASKFTADAPRKYKGANIQFDAILNKVGYHYPQQRIVVLWQDAMPIITKQQPPEPLVMRLNTFDCAVYSHTNLVPETLEMDDYQVRTPTDIIGQHIHLPKWDLTTTDGSANGWNYEDGTLSPGSVRERIEAINCFNGDGASCKAGVTPGTGTGPLLVAKSHPYFGQFGRPDWVGARTTMQRWFADPVVNTDGVDRGLGLIFTHDHYGPSTHQQIGLYATVLAEPAGSKWVHNETGQQLGYDPVSGAPASGRFDGGPTSWQAAILPPNTANSYREFYFEFSDFQHAYEAGKYVGAGPTGQPITAYAPPAAGTNPVTWIPNANNVIGTTIADSFRVAINPPARFQITPLYPDLVLEAAECVVGKLFRPCPQAISVQDPGMLVVNYRNEPIALRVFDPNKIGPDGRPGMQADGVAGDLAYALATQIRDAGGTITPITRKIAALNQTESQLGFWTKTLNAPTATLGGDPFTPMMRAYAGDTVRVKIQAGAHEEEHNATVIGMKWLQAGSGFGKAPNSGWRNSQAAGISEQFTLAVPVLPLVKSPRGDRDYAYNIDSSLDGWWSGTWGLVRTYDALRTDLVTLPNNRNVKPDRVANRTSFGGVCPLSAPAVNVDVIAILANELLKDRTPAGITISPASAVLDPSGPTRPLLSMHAGAPLTGTGSLIYNPRNTAIPTVALPADTAGTITLGGHAGPLHDPTAMLLVDARDVMPIDASASACKDSNGSLGVGKPACAIKLKPGRSVEPLFLRAGAGDCVNVTLYNRLPALAPDLPTLGTMMGVVKRDRNGAAGSVPFDNNLIRASSSVGIVPQLVAVDAIDQLGLNVGVNITQTVPPVDATGKVVKAKFSWYMGDLTFDAATNILTATPVEFGGVGLSPADRIKQGQKSLVGGLSVAPKGATITPDAATRAQATIVNGATTMRDFMLVMTKGINHRYADGAPVEHLNGEGAGIPEDPQENSAMALNYGIEPLWFRLALPPNAPFGNAGCAAGTCFGSEILAHEVYSNALVGADPVTPVFVAPRNTEVRVHSVVPHGTSRGTTLAFHGHVWQRDPYVCPGESRNGLPGACQMTGVGSKAIGDNPMGFAQGAQESVTPMSHFTYRFPKAGGTGAIPGDYLFRDQASFGNASGLWGILRVQ